MANVTTDSGTLAGPTAGIVPQPQMTLRIVQDKVNRTFYYYTNGAWTQFFQHAANTFLTETSVGVGGLSAVGARPDWYSGGELIQWNLTTP